MSSSEINPEVKIAGVICQSLVLYHDQRGWLAEIFRQDELAPEHFPVMAYISVTAPGMARGPMPIGPLSGCNEIRVRKGSPTWQGSS